MKGRSNGAIEILLRGPFVTARAKGDFQFSRPVQRAGAWDSQGTMSLEWGPGATPLVT